MQEMVAFICPAYLLYMRKTLWLLFTLPGLCCPQESFARHVKGGHIEYTYNGPGVSAGSSNYTFTVTVFFSCTTNGPKDNVYLGVYDAATNTSIMNRQIYTTSTNTVTKTSVNPCMSNPPAICYQIYTYVFTTDLPANEAGYIVTVQDALRVDGIMNIIGSGNAGITMNATIPGIIQGQNYHTNNSPHFIFKDTAIVCYQGNFSYQFEATDADGDSLSYSFGNGLNVTNAGGNTSTIPPSAPPYPPLTYGPGYSGTAPLGKDVVINAVTGLIAGTAPSYTGEYVVAVYVKEWRRGVLLDSVKKELQIYVYNCSLVAAALNNAYINCDNYTFNFQNESANSTVSSYLWDFGVPNNSTDTSTAPLPRFTYPDTGFFTLQLKVNTINGCQDSATAPVKVYPGFTPDFTVTGSCYQSPFLFKDVSIVKYGSTSLRWDFGDLGTDADTSIQTNAAYTYASPMQAAVTFIINSSKGCSATLTKNIGVTGKPAIALAFTDTLICSIDSLPLLAQSSSASIYSWTPADHLLNANSASPIAFPPKTTAYTVTVRDKDCIDSAVVNVRVLDGITVVLRPDTIICKTDSIRLLANTAGLRFEWLPTTGISNPAIKNPLVSPQATTTYTLTAYLGKCVAAAKETVRVVPYPTAKAGADTSICFGAETVLHGIVSGPLFTWTPAGSIVNTGSLDPVVHPLFTTAYVLTNADTAGCPKPSRDTVVVTVLQRIVLNAGNDTSVVQGQPLQLQPVSAYSGPLSYSWSPANWLNNSSIKNPVALINFSGVDSIRYTVSAGNSHGCTVSDDIRVLVYKTAPAIFMPTAFTPNGDGKNDSFKPVLAGIAQLNYFSIFNRWGQLIFSTAQIDKGWDGNINGHFAEAGSFVYTIQAKDYAGKTINKKGSFVLVK
jgi:gliding motility-associated-like protein